MMYFVKNARICLPASLSSLGRSIRNRSCNREQIFMNILLTNRSKHYKLVISCIGLGGCFCGWPFCAVLMFGSYAKRSYEPCQVGNEAALSSHSLCRKGAWRSCLKGNAQEYPLNPMFFIPNLVIFRAAGRTRLFSR